MRITRFEDIEAWKAARKLSGLVLEVTNNSKFSKKAGLRSQLRRAATSAMANIAEGFDRGAMSNLGDFLESLAIRTQWTRNNSRRSMESQRMSGDSSAASFDICPPASLEWPRLETGD